MRFLRAARLDDTDTQVYALAAQVGEPLVVGSFRYALSATDPGALQGKAAQAFRNGFFAPWSQGCATLAVVAEIEDAEYKSLIEALARYAVEALGAPGLDAALPYARDEVAYAADLCEQQPLNTLLALDRRSHEDGIRETFRRVKPQARWEGTEVKVWVQEPSR
jgi:hypothetical protein